MIKNKFRLSYSKLNSFANYDREEAIQMILGKRIPTTPEMQLGSDAHKIIEQERLDLEKIGEGGEYEVKRVTELFDWLDFSYIVDRRKDNIISDYKTGKNADPLQLYVYAFLLRLEDIKVDEGRIVYVSYDPKTRCVAKKSQRIYPIKGEQLSYAWNWIDENSHEVKEVLNNLSFVW